MQELGLVKGKMRSVLPLVSVLLLSLTVSCIVPIPQKVGTRGKITKRALEFLEEGVTSREQVLLHLGEPDFVGENEKIFVWDWVRAWDIWLVGSTGAGGFPDQQCNGLLIQFNDQASVQAVERWGKQMEYNEDCKWVGSPFLSTNEYTKNVHGFSIQFPPEWEVTRGSPSLGELAASDFPKDWGVKDGALNITARKAEGFFGLSFLWLSIAAYPIAEELDIWEVRPEPTALPPRMKFIMSMFASKEPDIIVNVLDSGRTTVNGSHAIWVKHQFESQDSTLAKISLTYSLVHDRKLFQISGHWDKEHEGDKYKQDIEEVIRSFRFIKPFDSDEANTEPEFPIEIRIKHRHVWDLWGAYNHATLVFREDSIEFRELKDQSHNFKISTSGVIKINSSVPSLMGNPSYTLHFREKTKAGDKISFEIDPPSLETLVWYLRNYCRNVVFLQ